MPWDVCPISRWVAETESNIEHRDDNPSHGHQGDIHYAGFTCNRRSSPCMLRAFISAPAWSSASTHSASPIRAARWSAASRAPTSSSGLRAAWRKWCTRCSRTREHKLEGRNENHQSNTTMFHPMLYAIHQLILRWNKQLRTIEIKNIPAKRNSNTFQLSNCFDISHRARDWYHRVLCKISKRYYKKNDK